MILQIHSALGLLFSSGLLAQVPHSMEDKESPFPLRGESKVYDEEDRILIRGWIREESVPSPLRTFLLLSRQTATGKKDG